ncbi:MAG: hypothetical protein ABF976_09445 [Acetobacter syzygii]|uniref:hypothetical protein n=1 Tax=Acetobacter syzygii TaxID=146476 RepID=UPI00242D5C12|nr:hypothetical protein [Acetobacter syzygii]
MSQSALRVVARIFLATGGGYLASSAVMALFSFTLVAMGMPRADAVTLGLLLVFIVYLCLGLWVFAARALWRPAALFAVLVIASYGVIAVFGHGG